MSKPNTIESVMPCSGQYSLKKDLRLNAWLAAATVLYLVIKLILQDHPEWRPLVRSLLELTPLIPGLFYVRTVVRYVHGMDELQRRVQSDALLFASLGALLITAIVNTLAPGAVVIWKDLKGGLGMGGMFVVIHLLYLLRTASVLRRYK